MRWRPPRHILAAPSHPIFFENGSPPFSRLTAIAPTRAPLALSAVPPHRVSHEAMREARVPVAFRDNCAGLLIPLNKCRQANMYMPFRCGHERHEYEKWCVQQCSALAGCQL